MNKEINLISSRRKEASITYRQINNIRIFSYIVLFCTLAVTAFLIYLNNTTDLTGLSQKEQALSQVITQSKNKVFKLALVRDRLQNIGKLQQNQSVYENIITSVTSALPSNASFDSMDLNQKTLNMVIRSSSLLSINTFLNYVIQQMNNKQLFQKITISSLIGDTASGEYTLTLTITLL